jgi:hypothetical protein
MKYILAIIILTLSLNVNSQSFYKDRKQDVRIENLITNGREVQTLYVGTSYANLGRTAESIWFFLEVESAIKQDKTVNTFIGNKYIVIKPTEEGAQISGRITTFTMSRKQLSKILKKLRAL